MPIYAYLCPDCGASYDLVRRMADDTIPVCHHCETPLERRPTAANFTITGYNAKNGYSRG